LVAFEDNLEQTGTRLALDNGALGVLEGRSGAAL
jgi:hypothetical protein